MTRSRVRPSISAERHPERRRAYLLGMYACLGLGVLTKGPVFLALPALVCGLWMLLEDRWRDVGRMMVLPGVLIIVAIVVPWYAADYAQHGLTHIKEFLIGENFGRYTSAMAGDRNPIFYLPVLFGDLLFPWAPLALMPLLQGWRATMAGETAPAASIRRLLWLWIVVTVAVFSFSQTKEDLYILPAVPALAVLAADGLVRLNFGSDSRGLRALLAVIAAACVLCGVAVYRVFGPPYLGLAGAAAGAIVLGAGGATMLAALWTRRARAAVVSLAAAFVIFNYLFVVQILPSSERFKPAFWLARTFKERATPSAALASYHLMLPSLVFYAEQPVEDIDADERARAFFARSRPAWVVTSAEDFERLQQLVPSLCVVERRPRLDVNLRNVMSGASLPMALLATNQCER